MTSRQDSMVLRNLKVKQDTLLKTRQHQHPPKKRNLAQYSAEKLKKMQTEDKQADEELKQAAQDKEATEQQPAGEAKDAEKERQEEEHHVEDEGRARQRQVEKEEAAAVAAVVVDKENAEPCAREETAACAEISVAEAPEQRAALEAEASGQRAVDESGATDSTPSPRGSLLSPPPWGDVPRRKRRREGDDDPQSQHQLNTETSHSNNNNAEGWQRMAVWLATPRPAQEKNRQHSEKAKQQQQQQECRLAHLLDAAVEELEQSRSESGRETGGSQRDGDDDGVTPECTVTIVPTPSSQLEAQAASAARAVGPQCTTWLASTAANWEAPQTCSRKQLSATGAPLISFASPSSSAPLGNMASSRPRLKLAHRSEEDDERYYCKAIQSLQTSLGFAHPELGKAYLQLACFYYRRGQQNHTESCLLRSWTVFKQHALCTDTANGLDVVVKRLETVYNSFLCILKDFNCTSLCTDLLDQEKLELDQQLAQLQDPEHIPLTPPVPEAVSPEAVAA